MTDFAYGLLNWIYLGSHYTAKASSAVYRKTLYTSQRYRDKRIKAAAREDPLAYSWLSTDVAEYIYRPLSPDSHIRILLVEPGRGGELLRCSLEHVDLDTQPQFNALSYCWGEIAKSRIVSCEGYSISITRNLYDALLRLRSPDTVVRIWADALCINQKDRPERKQQIPLMRRIYYQAEICFAWLGPHTELDALAFKLLDTIHDYLQNHPSDVDGKGLKPGRILATYSTTPGEWEGLSRLFARPWFERVWTLEEIVLPRQALIVAGRFAFDANRFFEIVDYVHSNELEAQMHGLEGGYLQSLKVAALRKEFHEHSSDIDLFDTLRNARDRDAYDARDKVIAVLGICQHDPDWASTLGYQMSPKDVYISVATHILSSPAPFRLFSACCPATHSTKLGGSLPSWVPDWSVRVSSVPCIQYFEGNKKYEAGGCAPSSVNVTQLPDGAEVLSIKGRKISLLKSIVYRHSNTLKRDFRNTYYPQKSICEKIGDWYFYIALAWVFECLDDEEKGRPDMTIEQFFLATCWSTCPADCGVKRFWETMTCSLTNAKRNEALQFQKGLMKYARRVQQHDVDNTIQTAFLHNLDSWTRIRKFCVTANGLIGWVPIEAREGDIICVFEGAQLPYVLRKTSKEDVHVIIGHCFLHGIMFGEAMASNEVVLEDIKLG